MDVEPFTKFRDVPASQIEAAISSLTEDEWQRLEQGYIDGISQHIADWWIPMLGLVEGVDSSALFCRLYQLSVARTEEV